MRLYSSTISLIALSLVFLLVISFFLFVPGLAFILVKSCRSFFLSCQSTLFSLLSSPRLYFWLPFSLFFFAIFISLARFSLSHLFLRRLKKSGKLPPKIAQLKRVLPELEKYKLFRFSQKNLWFLQLGLKNRVYIFQIA